MGRCFDVARFSSSTSDSCSAWGSVISVTATIDEAVFADEELVIYEVLARNEADELSGVDRQRMSWLQFGPQVLFEQSGDAFPLEGWCVDIAMIDAAGNRGSVASSCEACMRYDGAPVTDVAEIPFEPAPGGPCDPGEDSSSTSGVATSDGTTSDGTSSTASTSLDESPEASGALDSSDTAATGDDSTALGDEPSDRGCACASTRRVDAGAAAWLLALVAATTAAAGRRTGRRSRR